MQNRLPPDLHIEREYAEIPQIYCAARQINQVFMSVLKNAIVASGASGHIHIHLWAKDDEVRVCIAAERLERIFDFNFNQDDGRVRMGAGLAMAYRIVEMHNGRIEIESKVGVGRQVDFRLPQHQGNE
ncbi:MAG: ATP-binding protein [Candidatus Latescibacterota bacterium]